MGKLFNFLGLSCAAVQSTMTSPEQYRHAYACDITYVTGQELCFSYLKDNTAQMACDLVRLVLVSATCFNFQFSYMF